MKQREKRKKNQIKLQQFKCLKTLLFFSFDVNRRRNNATAESLLCLIKKGIQKRQIAYLKKWGNEKKETVRVKKKDEDRKRKEKREKLIQKNKENSTKKSLDEHKKRKEDKKIASHRKGLHMYMKEASENYKKKRRIKKGDTRIRC